MNPCPCGNYPDFSKCNCTPWQIRQYLDRISQPFLDRIDICVEAPKLQYEEIRESVPKETSAVIRRRVEAVRSIQQKRYEGQDILNNAMLGVRQIDEFCRLGKEEEFLMKQAFTSLNLTARTYHKILKVSRTIADLDESEIIQDIHVREASGYRLLEQKH